MSEIQASERLMDLIFEAVEEGLHPLRDGSGLSPFVLLLTKTGYVLQRFMGDTMTIRLEKAYKTLQAQDEDTLAYTLIYDSVVTVDKQDYDAVMIEAGERGYETGLRFVQRYQAPSEKRPFATIGAIALLGKADQYLKKST